MNLRVFSLICLVAFLALGAFAQQGQSPLPQLPSDIPKDAQIWMLLVDKAPSGQDALWTTPDGAIHEFFQFNDRGRGPKTYSTYHLDNRGIVTSEETHGNDYMKNAVNETFTLKDGVATWKNQAEDEHENNAAGRFFVGVDAGPAAGFQLAQALLKNGGKLPLLPGGEASIKALQTVPVDANGKKMNATLYEMEGLRFTPQYLWLDDQRNPFAAIDGWSGLMRRVLRAVRRRCLRSRRTCRTSAPRALPNNSFIIHPAMW